MSSDAGNSDAGNVVILCGSGRSGTTWVAELLNHDHRFRYMFEPFWGQRVDICRHFNARQYLRPEDSDPAFLDPAAQILSGRLRSPWVDQFHQRSTSTGRLIKEIRGNLLLAWLHAHFPAAKIVFLLRHPGAVVASRMRLGWDEPLDQVLTQHRLIEDHLASCLGDGAIPRDAFDRHLTLWCIENRVPLRQLRSGSVHVVFYEHLCTDPETEVQKIFGFLGLNFEPAVMDRFHRPSSMADEGSAVNTGQDLLAGWRSILSPSQLDRLDAVVHAFGLDRIYTSDIWPHTRDPLASPGQNETP